MAVEGNPSLALKAKLFRGLADGSRLAILETLRGGEKAVSDIVADTGLSQPNASAHLACLRECGLVMGRQEGRFVYYALSDPRLEAVLSTVEDVLARVGERVYACTRYGTLSAGSDVALERPPSPRGVAPHRAGGDKARRERSRSS